MENKFPWEVAIQGFRTTMRFGNGVGFRLTVLQRNDGEWEWSTASELGMFFRAGQTDLGDAEARRLAEEAIEPIAEEARAWHQARADRFREVLAEAGLKGKPPATPMPGPGQLVTNG